MAIPGLPGGARSSSREIHLFALKGRLWLQVDAKGKQKGSNWRHVAIGDMPPDPGIYLLTCCRDQLFCGCFCF